MSAWSDKYIGVAYEFGGRDISVGTDCLRLVEVIYLKELGLTIEEDGKSVEENWYVNNPDRLIREAVTRGEVIIDISKLKEFDAVFFKLKDDVIRHIGVMTDNYGHFLHQMSERPSRIDDLHTRHWGKRFFCGVRPKHTK